MKSTMKLLAALVLLGVLGACAQFGMSGPDDPAIYESSLSD